MIIRALLLLMQLVLAYQNPMPMLTVPNVDVRYNEAVIKQILDKHCGTGATSNIVFPSNSSTAQSRVDFLLKISSLCKESCLPFAARDVWHYHADVYISRDDGFAFADSAKDLRDHNIISERLRGCQHRSAPAWACKVFVHTDVMHTESFAKPLFAYLEKHPRERIILISSSNNDYCVPCMTWTDDLSCASRLKLLRHPQVYRWFAENPCIVDPKLEALPLGVNMPTPQHKSQFSTMLANFLPPDSPRRVDSIMVRLTLRNTDDPLYTPHKNIRKLNLEHILSLAKAMNESMVTPNLTESVRWNDYYRELLKYKYAWAPPGRGIDTHRAWECLLAGCVPIVLNSPISKVYTGLQVVLVEDFQGLQRRHMRHFSKLIDSRKESDSVDYLANILSPMYAFYWLQRIDESAMLAMTSSNSLLTGQRGEMGPS